MAVRDNDRSYVAAALPELQEYLLSEELYWPLGGAEASLLRLTIGGLLLALRRCGDERLAREADAVRLRWRAAWEAKARREAQSRLEQWRLFLEDLRQARETHAQDYPGQVRVRVMLDLLLADLPSLPAVSVALDGLDHTLRAAFIPGEFLWDDELGNAFPQDTFWYLYGRLRD